MSKDAGMRGAPSMPAEIIVGNAIDLVIALRNVCTLADPELASECRRRRCRACATRWRWTSSASTAA